MHTHRFRWVTPWGPAIGLFAVLAVVICLISFPLSAGARGAIDQQMTNPAFYQSEFSFGGDNSAAETFTAGLSGTLTEVDVSVGNYMNAITATIEGVNSDGTPNDGEVFATTTVPLADANVTGWLPFVFSTPSVAGDKYAIVLSAPTSEGTAWFMGTSYSGGGAWYDDSSGWRSLAFYEPTFLFKTYVTGPAVNTTTAPQDASADYGASSVSLNAQVSASQAVSEGTVSFQVTNSQHQNVGSAVSQDVTAGGQATASYTLPSGLLPGSYTVTASYTDPIAAVANFQDSSGTSTLTIVDNLAPTTMASYGGYTAGNWTNQSVTVTLSPTDNPNPGGSGVDTTYYAVDQPDCTASTNGLGNCTAYDQPFTISANGIHTLTYFSVDKAGNIESANSATVKIDTVAPMANPTVSGVQGTGDVWYTGPVTITWNWSDSTPGAGIDTAACTSSSTYSGPDSVTATADASCQDKAGNTGSGSQDFKYDATPPNVQCSPPSSSTWYDQNVTVSCTAGDATSHLADTSLTTFNLRTTLSSGAASSSTPTGTRQVCDNAGNCVTSGPYTFKVDLAPPTITSPLAGSQYTVNQSVTLDCHDVGSGINACAVTVTGPTGTSTVTHGSDLPTGQPGIYTITPDPVTDIAGNTDTASFSYTVAYQLAGMPGSTTKVTHGYFAMIRVAPMDVLGQDVASRSQKARTVELDGPNGQVIPFIHTFQFTMAHHTPQYQLELNTRNLTPGTWTLKLTIGSEKAIVYAVSFTIE